MSGGVVLMSQAEKVKEQRTAENQSLSLRIHQVLFLPLFGACVGGYVQAQCTAVFKIETCGCAFVCMCGGMGMGMFGGRGWVYTSLAAGENGQGP